MSDAPGFAAQFAFDVTAEDAHIDALGHVNHKVYVAWAEEAGVRHWRRAASAAEQVRWLWVASRLEVDFVRETLAGEALRVETRVEAPRGARFDRFVRILGADGRPKALVKYTWALIDAAARRPVRVPPELAARFTQV